MSKFIVGLTGGIGSGKSAVSERFENLGIRVVDADIASRVIVEPGRPALAAIAERVGGMAVIAEVRNTFGERHCYLLKPRPGEDT